jgi:YgiT-type zinc finger domain-containing protein
MTKCYFCKDGDLVEKNIDVSFWWGNQLLHFSSVPALVCDVCGEKYFSPEVSRKLTELAKEVANGRRQSRRIMIPSLDFGEEKLELAPA